MINKFKYLPKNPANSGIFCFCLFTYLSFGICNAGFTQAIIKFSDTKKNFGFVRKGEVVTLDYEFKNTGTEPLLITNTDVACSCTIIDYPKQPIAPQQTGHILIHFDTKTVYDRQDRTVSVISNAKNTPTTLRFKGVVLKAKK